MRRVGEITQLEPEVVEEYVGGSRVEVRLWHGDQEITMRGYLENLQIRDDFIDASVFGESKKTYLAGERRFTLEGRVAPWRKKESRS